MDLAKLQRKRRWVVGSLIGLNVWGNGAMAIMYAQSAFKTSSEIVPIAIAVSATVWIGIAWLVNRVMKRRERSGPVIG